VTSLKRLARIGGVLYLIVGIFGGFAQGSGAACDDEAQQRLDEGDRTQ
jgi:hypothetical protein